MSLWHLTISLVVQFSSLRLKSTTVPHPGQMNYTLALYNTMGDVFNSHIQLISSSSKVSRNVLQTFSLPCTEFNYIFTFPNRFYLSWTIIKRSLSTCLLSFHFENTALTYQPRYRHHYRFSYYSAPRDPHLHKHLPWTNKPYGKRKTVGKYHCIFQEKPLHIRMNVILQWMVTFHPAPECCTKPCPTNAE